MKSSLLKAHLNAAEGYAKLSHAERLKVGAVLVRDGRGILEGWNGTVKGADNTCEDDEGNTLPTVMHAESNVIGYAAKYGVATNDCALITTDSPCYDCAKLLVTAGIKEVYYWQEYRDIEPLYYLQMNNVKVEKMEF